MIELLKRWICPEPLYFDDKHKRLALKVKGLQKQHKPSKGASKELQEYVNKQLAI